MSGVAQLPGLDEQDERYFRAMLLAFFKRRGWF